MHFKISDEIEKLGSRVFANKIYVPYLESPMLKVRMSFFEEWGMWAQNFGITRIRTDPFQVLAGWWIFQQQGVDAIARICYVVVWSAPGLIQKI